jgi:subtilisin-like proprotein convertase family protein
MSRRNIAAGAALAAALAVTALNPPTAFAAPTTLVVSNAAAIAPPDNLPSGTASQLAVAGQTGLVTDLDVTLNGFGSTYPGDLDIMLQGPNGRSVMLMSDSCGGTDVANLSIRFDDEASTRVPSSDACTSGSFWPSDGADLDDPTFPVPTSLSLSAFDQASPNGTWTLFVADDDDPDTSVIAGGFTLSLQLSDRVGPTVTFAKTPKPSTKTTQKVSFTADDAGSTFECNIDGVGWNDCTSPVKLKRLSVGKHKLEVRATDPTGNRGAPATVKVKVKVKVKPKR